MLALLAYLVVAGLIIVYSYVMEGTFGEDKVLKLAGETCSLSAECLSFNCTASLCGHTLTNITTTEFIDHRQQRPSFL
jgi:uncharacterized protein (UPF0333 family)